MLTDFFAEHVLVNSSNSTHDALLHCCSPDHPLLANIAPVKAIYCYEDPRISVLSLFERNLAQGMQAKLRYFGSNLADYNKLSKDYAARVHSIDEMIQLEYDCFGINNFWQNWTSVPASFPIMIVSYQQLWTHTATLLEFAGVPSTAHASFPLQRRRQSSLQKLCPHHADALETIYKDTIDAMSKTEACLIRPATPSWSERRPNPHPDKPRERN